MLYNINAVFEAAYIEVWLSLVERYVRDVEAGGSNPLTSTILKSAILQELRAFL